MAGRVRHLVQRGDAFYARIVVPSDLRPIIGTTELRAPLGSNRKVAERDLHAAVASFHQQLATARAKLEVSASPPARMRARPLTTAQIAHTHYAEELALDDRERAHPDHQAVADMDWTRQGFSESLRRVAAGKASTDETVAVIGWAIAKLRERGSSNVEPGTPEWRALARTLAQVQLEAVSAAIERDAGGEPAPPKLPILADPPTPVPAGSSRQRGPAVSILDLLDGYLRTLKAQGKGAEAERRWRPVFKALVRFLGYDDARHLTKADLIRWKDHLQEVEKLAPRTIRDAHLASLRAVLNWAVDNDKLPENAAARVRIDVAKPVRGREKGFVDDEAIAILKAADAYVPASAHSPATRESAHVTAAKRWLPWLCALTGARVAEMAQLRGRDIREEQGITHIRITPDAGSVKTGQYRDVPVHPQLIDRGFLNFVRSAGEGALFYDEGKSRRGAQHPSKIVAIRALIMGEGPLAGLFGTAPAASAGSNALGGIIGGIGKLFGFSEGGYTGPGGKYDPAGIVHKDEFVINAAQTRKRRALLEAINAGSITLPGYANGGMVGGAAAPATAAEAGSVVTISPTINLTASGGTPEQNQDLAKRLGSQIEGSMRGVVIDEIRRQLRPNGILNR